MTKRVVVELINHESVRRLQSDYAVTKKQLDDLRKRFHDLEVKYGYEVHLNSELCDICRRHGFDFRPLLDHNNR